MEEGRGVESHSVPGTRTSTGTTMPAGKIAAYEKLGPASALHGVQNRDMEHIEWTKSFNDTQTNLA
jgi:hypothetical protein